MQTFYLTDPGKVRTHNEDNVTILNNNNQEFLLAVADGMGGHRAGEIASSITINHLTKSFKEKETIGTKEEAIHFLKQAVSEANEKIYAYTEDDNIRSQNLCKKLGMRQEGFFKEFISFVKNPDGTPKYENTLQFAILKKEWRLRSQQKE